MTAGAPAPQRTSSVGRAAGRGRAGHPARAVLRPRLRPGAHAVHRADGRRADLGGARQGAAGARRAVVVVVGLRVADERGRPRGRPRPPGDLRRDGRVPGRRAARAARVRARTRSSSPPPTRSCAPRTSRCSGWPAARIRACARRSSAWRSARCWPSGLLRGGVGHRRHAPGAAVGRRARRRPRRAAPAHRRRRLADGPGALRRALRPDRDHRAGRVDRGHRRRGGVGLSRGARSPPRSWR